MGEKKADVWVESGLERGRDRGREGSVSHMSSLCLYHDGRQGFSVCLDRLEQQLYFELTGTKI